MARTAGIFVEVLPREGGRVIFLRTLLFVLVPIMASTAVFAAAHVYRYGWDAAIYNGQDPWALFFFALGGAFVPLAVSTVIAGIRTLLSRSSGFLRGWLVIFTVTTIVFAVPNFYVAVSSR